MDRRSNASTVSPRVGRESTQRRVARGTHAVAGRNRSTQLATGEPHLKLAETTRRDHTLILSGQLDRRSASTLEAEIERLHREDVAGITLDLRGLTHIDSIGIAMIAFRSRLCKRTGCELEVIAGSRLVHRACEQAGITAQMGYEDDGAVPVPSSVDPSKIGPFQRRLRAVIRAASELNRRAATNRRDVG